MDQKTKRELLAKLFTMSKRENGEEYIHFTDDAIYSVNDLQNVYKAVSDAQHDSGISFNFSYEIASRAAVILADLEEWNDEDAMHDMIDSGVPIYNSELMKIYASDWDLVDELIATDGPITNIVQATQSAWYHALTDMVAAIRANLEMV